MRYILYLLLTIDSLALSKSEVSDNSMHLFGWDIKDVSTDGRCTIFYPLDGMEVFSLDEHSAKLKGLKFHIETTCTASYKSYTTRITINNNSSVVIGPYSFNPFIHYITEKSAIILDYDYILPINVFDILIYGSDNEGINVILSNFTINTHVVYGSSEVEMSRCKDAPPLASSPTLHAMASKLLDLQRDDFPSLLNAFNLTGTAAEIGVHAGIYAANFLSLWRGRRYFLVDPWLPQSRDVYMDSSNLDGAAFNQIYETAKERVALHKDRVVFFRMFSDEAAAMVPEESLDFVYIDARHDYHSVIADMRAWWPKVKRGAVFAGHDFQMEMVRLAVTDFSRKMCVPLHRTVEPGSPSWFIVKP